MKEGLGDHIREHAYDYNQMVTKEITRIRRIQELKLRLVNVLISFFFAAMVGAFNLLFKLFYDDIVAAGWWTGLFTE